MVGGSHPSCKGREWCKNSNPKNRKQIKKSAASAGFYICDPKGEVDQIVESDKSEVLGTKDDNDNFEMPTTSSANVEAAATSVPLITKRTSAARPKLSHKNVKSTKRDSSLTDSPAPQSEGQQHSSLYHLLYDSQINHSHQPEDPMDTDEPHDSFLLDALKKMPDTTTTNGHAGDQIAIFLDGHDLLLLDQKEAMAVSAYLCEQCKQPPVHCRNLTPKTAQKYNRVKQLFTLSSDAGEETPGLVQVPLDYDIETYLRRFQPAPIDHRPGNLKQEGGADSMDTDIPLPETRVQKNNAMTPTEAYKALFQLLRLSPPGVIPLKDENGIKATLLSHVVSLGSRLQALPTLRTNMGLFFYRMGAIRWAAVKKDPPLWLCIAEALEDAEIYKEAAIHLIGCQLQWLPEWSISKNHISPAAMDRLERSADKLMLQVFKVKQALNQATVCKHKTVRAGTITSEPVSPEFHPAAWIVVSICREFWAVNCAVLDDGQGNYNMRMIAELYRTIERGGETYLATQSVHNIVRDNHRGSVNEVMWVLPEMKNFASEQVRPLLKNNLQYNGEKQLGYFTCAELEDRDFPFEIKKVEDNDF